MKTFLLGLALMISLSGFSKNTEISRFAVGKTTPFFKWENEEPKNAFSIFPLSVKKSAKLTITAQNEAWATLELRDKCGNVVLEQQMGVNKGTNTIPVFFISKIEKGEYTSVLKIEDKTYFSKLVKE
jgi:hypothetical protein